MKTKIGGQAVIEGVMMRGQSSMALAVRDELGNIRVETTRLSATKPWYRKVPFLRGVINLITSMIDGTKITYKSAEVMVEEEIDTSENNGTGALMGLSMLFGFALAMVLFVFLPTLATNGFFTLTGLDGAGKFAWLKSLIEGVVKMVVLVAYMVSVSQMKEIKRVFMYHGAEHKTISCYENELPLTVENVQKCSRYHDRCGTSFIVFVVVLSIVLMMVLDVVCVACGFTAFVEKKNWWLRALLKIALLPITAGISYETLMLLAKSNFVLFRPLKWLGKHFQRLTTREPDDDMCQVAITAFTKVLEMDADQTIAEQRFPDPLTVSEFIDCVEKSSLPSLIGIHDIKWLTAAVLNIKVSDLDKNLKIPFGWKLRVEKMCQRIEGGEPWQYVIGRVEFYSRNYCVTNDTLIPRLETELVCEQLLKQINKKDAKVLDMCTGTGILGITVALEKQADVTLADISKDALKVAKFNAKSNNAKVKFLFTDMFAKVDGMFDYIVCNPPYIATDVIQTLDDSVKKYEPIIALDGGNDGLDFYRIFAKEAPKHLKKDGVAVLEIGYDQGQTAKEILSESFVVEVKKDYSQNDRIVIAKLKTND